MLGKLNDRGSPFVHRFFYASELTQDVSHLITKVEGVQCWAEIQAFLEQSELI